MCTSHYDAQLPALRNLQSRNTQEITKGKERKYKQGNKLLLSQSHALNRDGVLFSDITSEAGAHLFPGTIQDPGSHKTV